MKLSFTTKFGNLRVGSSIRMNSKNFLLVSIAAMLYYTIYMMILVTEFSFRILWLILKGMWALTKWCAYKIKQLILFFIDKIKKSREK